MQLTSEEMETLNRSTEILSRFVNIGAIKKESFDLFEQMVVSAIDSKKEQEEIKRTSSSKSPFSRIILPFMVGFFDDNNEPSFFTDVNIVNLQIIDNSLTFKIYSSKTEEKLRAIKEFSIAPILAMTKDDDGIVFVRQTMPSSGAHYSIEKCTSVNAPFETSAPIVFECSIESMDCAVLPNLTAKIHKVNMIESSIENNGEFDICSAWARMGWVEQSISSN